MASKATPTDEEIAAAKTFITENTKMDDKGVTRRGTGAGYFDYMKTHHAIPEAQVRAVTKGDATLADAAVRVAADDLVPRIAAAKKKGDDPADLKSEVVLPTPTGRITVSCSAQSTHRIPATGETSTKYGGVRAQIRLGSPITRDAAEYAAGIVAAEMGVGKKK